MDLPEPLEGEHTPPNPHGYINWMTSFFKGVMNQSFAPLLQLRRGIVNSVDISGLPRKTEFGSRWLVIVSIQTSPIRG